MSLTLSPAPCAETLCDMMSVMREHESEWSGNANLETAWALAQSGRAVNDAASTQKFIGALLGGLCEEFDEADFGGLETPVLCPFSWLYFRAHEVRAALCEADND